MHKEFYCPGILGIGIFMPETIVKNDFWDNIPILNSPKKDKDPFEGTEERRFFPENTVPSDVEIEAGKRALEDAGVSPDEIDLVIVHSMLQDEIIPGNASLVQYKMGLKNAGAWNMDTCCSSFVTMFITASHLVALGTFRKILLINSVIHSQMMDFSHYISPTLGDGASAVVVGRVSQGRGYIASHCQSDGYYHDAFTMREMAPMAYEKSHYKPSLVKPTLTFNSEKVHEIGKKSRHEMSELISITLNKAGINAEDVDFMVTHQPSRWAHDAWKDALGVPSIKSLQTFKNYGNLASATIPVNLFESRKEKMLREDDIVLMASPGAGKNNSIALLKWGK